MSKPDLDLSKAFIGMTQSQVRETFGEPNAVGATSRRQSKPALFAYGNHEGEDDYYEFHFNPKDGYTLWMIMLQPSHEVLISIDQ